MKVPFAEFLEMTAPVDTLKWQMPVVEKTTVSVGTIFGGIGLAAGVVAMEQAARKPPVWATSQYISFARRPSTLTLDVEILAEGRSATQMQVRGTESDRSIINIIGACGRRDSEFEGTWEKRPSVLDPEHCPPVELESDGDSINQHVEIRLAYGMYGYSGQGTPTGEGETAFWMRTPRIEHDAGALAFMADFMPSSIADAAKTAVRPTSLDNTIRYATIEPTEWVLCENSWDHLRNGFGYGTMHMWSTRGTLLATASQSMIVRTP